MTFAIFLAAVLLSAAEPAAADPADFSPVEIAAFKASIAKSCRDTGRGRGEPSHQVDRACACIAERLEARLSLDEWKRAMFFAQHRRVQEEMDILGPHMSPSRECLERSTGA